MKALRCCIESVQISWSKGECCKKHGINRFSIDCYSAPCTLPVCVLGDRYGLNIIDIGCSMSYTIQNETNKAAFLLDKSSPASIVYDRLFKHLASGRSTAEAASFFTVAEETSFAMGVLLLPSKSCRIAC
jgi:hypothetical protein